MPAVLSQVLLDRDENRGQRVSRRVVIAATTACLLVSASFVGFSLGTMSGDSEVDPDFVHAKLTSIKHKNNETELAVVAYSAQCYGFIGSTCEAAKCDRTDFWTGVRSGRNATCADEKCVCQGGCTGADGNCYNQKYTKVASKITLSPDWYPNYWLYMQSFSVAGQLKTSRASSWTFRGAQYFDLYELPGVKREKKQYVLVSNKWPSYAVGIMETFLGGGALNPSKWDVYGVSLNDAIAPKGITVEVCSNQSNNGAVMIGRGAPADNLHQAEWAYVHPGSWFVYAWMDHAENRLVYGSFDWIVQDENGDKVNIQGLDSCSYHRD